MVRPRVNPDESLLVAMAEDGDAPFDTCGPRIR